MAKLASMCTVHMATLITLYNYITIISHMFKNINTYSYIVHHNYNLYKRNTNLTLTVERLHKIFTNYKPRATNRKIYQGVVRDPYKYEDPSHP